MSLPKFQRILIALVTATALVAAETPTPDFETAYLNDHLWPSHVTPKADIKDHSGAQLLRADIPVVLIRAYKDGHLAIIDRSGSHLIDHSKTDFIKQVNEARRSDTEVNTRLLLNQLGRRIYDRSYDETKAVPEAELARYSKFMIIRISTNKTALPRILEALHGMREHFSEQKIRPVLVFDEAMPNQAFYELVKQLDIPYPAVAPIFQKGLTGALFSEREQNSRVLLLSISGKLLGKFSHLEDYAP